MDMNAMREKLALQNQSVYIVMVDFGKFGRWTDIHW